MKITVGTKELIDILECNMVTHQKDYDEAKAAYAVACRTELVDMLNTLEEKGSVGKKISITAPRPVRYTKEYEKAIAMLKLHQPAAIVLDADEYSRFVDDEWTWSRAFAASTLSYKNG